MSRCAGPCSALLGFPLALLAAWPAPGRADQIVTLLDGPVIQDFNTNQAWQPTGEPANPSPRGGTSLPLKNVTGMLAVPLPGASDAVPRMGDLFFFGDLSGEPAMARLGKRGRDGDHVLLGAPVVLPGTRPDPVATWLNPASGHLAVAVREGGQDRIRFYQAERLSLGYVEGDAPPDWGMRKQVNIGAAPTVLAATSPGALFAGGLVSDSTYRVLRLDAAAADVGTCRANETEAGRVAALSAITWGTRGVVAGLQRNDPTSPDPLKPTRLALTFFRETCSGSEPALGPWIETKYPLDGLAAVEVALPAAMGRATLILASYGGKVTLWRLSDDRNKIDLVASVDVDVSGGLAVSARPVGQLDPMTMDAPVLDVIAGNSTYRDAPNRDAPNRVIVWLQARYLPATGQFRLQRGGELTGTQQVSAVVTQPSANAGLSERVLKLGTTPDNRLLFAELQGLGGLGMTILAGPTCKGTSVVDGKRVGATVQLGTIPCKEDNECGSGACKIPMGMMMGTCLPLLEVGKSQGRYRVPADQAIVAFTQSNTGPTDKGEVCSISLVPDGQQVGMQVLIEGTTQKGRALALVLDRSGSMWSAVSQKRAEARHEVLQRAVRAFLDTTKQLPDAASLNLAIFPFHTYVRPPQVKIVPEAGFLNATDMAARFEAEPDLLKPQDYTNIRGALKVATDRLATFDGRRSLLLMSDGEHNTAGQVTPEDVRPEDVEVYDLPTRLPEAAAYFLRRQIRLYSIALSEASAYQNLKTMSDEVARQPETEGVAFLDYAEKPEELFQFFNKVLWEYLGATKIKDPIVIVDDNRPCIFDLDLHRGDTELIANVAWADPRRSMQVKLEYQDPNSGVAAVRCVERDTSVSCYADARKTGARRYVLTITKQPQAGAGPVEVMVEAAGRSQTVQLRGGLRQGVYYSGERLHFQFSLTEQGLPLRGAKVVGVLTVPQGSLGSALANARIGEGEISARQKTDPDLRGVAAKMALMRPEQIPGRREQEIVLYDDGMHGDQGAGDGVYGAQVEAAVPGLYRVLVRAEYDSALSGKGAREATVTTHVGVGLNGARTVRRVRDFQAPGVGQPGSLVVELRPQDAAGNLLGPGSGGVLEFRQGRRRLPVQISEPGNYDGSYTAQVSDIRLDEGPVVLGSGGGGFVLLSDPSINPWTGCGCRVGGAGGDGGAMALCGGLAMLAVLILRRRRRVPHAG